MSFLGKLADQINNQMSVGENENHSLDAVVDGQNQKYGSLGDFAKKVDQSSERRYVEEGYLRKDPFNTEPKQFEVLMQEPNATVLLKKRMFSSINENYRPDFMDADEKLYYKAMKILFQNKCRQISALEKLSKIQKITDSVGNVAEQLMPIIISLSDEATAGFPDLGGAGKNDLFGQINNPGDISNFAKVIDRVRRVYAFNKTNNLTTWITDPTNLFQSQFGQGTGVIEITNFTNVSTTVTTDIKSPGNFTLSISDPYECMLITEYDIERALSDATNSFYNHKIFQFGQQSAEQVIADTAARLNQLRALRKVSPISFKVNPDTLLGRRVVAVVDRKGVELPFTYDAGFGGLGGGVSVSDEYLVNGAVLGIDGLDTERKSHLGPDSNIKALYPESEKSVFGRLVTAIFSKLSLDANSRGAFVTTNKLTNYARRKLRFNFAGKPIVQPMDTVHIYMNSKSRFDGKLLSGLNNMFTGSGILQNLNKTITDLKNSIDTVFNPGGSVNLQVEKAAFVGPDFPNYLWSVIRNQFVNEKEGTHVFAGIVQGANSAWNDGKFTISVNGSDNAAYFEMGKINFKPSADVFNGSFFDPLTPFKTKFDTISSNAKEETPVLLNENQYLLGTSQDKDAPIVKFKLGPNAGKPVHTDNVSQDVAIDDATRALSKVFYAPDGLVYKWKEGIGTLVQFGSSIEVNDPKRLGAQGIAKEPFAGQDVMNVLSLLVTGQPYNFATYWKAVANFDGFNRDPHSQQDSAYSYFDSLKNDLGKNNSVWGNFIPFKTLSISEKSFAGMMSSLVSFTRANQDLETKLKKLSDAKAAARIFGNGKAIAIAGTSKYNDNYMQAQKEVDLLEVETNDLIKSLQASDKFSNSKTQFGSDVSYDFNEFLNDGNPNRQLSDDATRRLLRRQINFLTRRMSYNVRANEDKNLFIVDDSYDKDYDIAAFESSLNNGLKLFNNEFHSVKDKILQTADLLNLEVFADTQGHIRVRSPQYNRMPSSIFYRMMFLKQSTGIQVFPQFLDDLFGDQIKGLTERVEILEDQIRLDCAVLGIGSAADGTPDPDFIADGKATAFLSSSGATANKGEPFSFISNSNGVITDIITALDAANPLTREQLSHNETFANITLQATKVKEIFPNTQRFQAVLDAITKPKLALAGYSIQDIPSFSNNKRIDNLIQRIQVKSGQKISRTSFLVTNDIFNNGPAIPAGDSIDIFKVTQELSERIGERQRALKALYSAVKNSVEARSLDDDSSTGSRLLTPGLYGNSHTPEIFEHMIEDESYDDYGTGSGKRYIIKRAQIKSLTIGENPPDYTTVTVTGRIDINQENSTLPSDLNVFAGSGNSLVSASAIDYDMWRNYGFREQSPLNLPFLSDPNTQCAPYASMMLSRARRNILRGSVTISGNEFMQPGEVIFLEDRGMLFYVSAVKHNFNFGASFTTTLDLTYGHTPGEYIPTPLDVIGKMLYKNRDVGGITVQRQSSSSSDKNVGIVLRDPKNAVVFNKGDAKDTVTAFSAANTATINNILYSCAYLINANNTKGNNIKASVELRVYKDKNNGTDADLMAFAENVKSALTVDGEGPKQSFNKNNGTSGNPILTPADSVQVKEIDLSDNTVFSSPSQRAIDAARNYISIASTSGGGASGPGSPSVNGFGSALAGIGSAVANTFSSSGGTGVDSGDAQSSLKQRTQLKSVLYKYIVDIWVKFEEVPAAEAKAQGI